MTNDVYGYMSSTSPSNPAPSSPIWSVSPGQRVFYSSAPSYLPGYYYFFSQGLSVPNQTPYYAGSIRQNYGVDVNPDTKKVSFIGQYLTERDLLAFKGLHPSNTKIQALTLAELKARYKPNQFRGHNVRAHHDSVFVRSNSVTACEYDIGVVVVDCIFALTGAFGLAGKISGTAVESVASIVKPVMSEMVEALYTLGTALSKENLISKALAIKNIIHVIWSGSMIEAVYHAIMESLEWWDMVIYGVLGISTIFAAFLTDGAALVAMIAAEIALMGFLISDSVKAVEACDITSSEGVLA